MNPWWHLNGVLALCVALLLAVDLWPRDDPADRLTNLSLPDVEQIRIERGDRLQLAFERRDGQWRLTHPRHADVLQNRVEQLLAVARAPVRRRFPAGTQPGDYGLDPPGSVVQFNELRIAFGDRDTSQERRYVQAGDLIGLIDGVYFNLLTLPTSHFTGD